MLLSSGDDPFLGIELIAVALVHNWLMPGPLDNNNNGDKGDDNNNNSNVCTHVYCGWIVTLRFLLFLRLYINIPVYYTTE